jgi:small subunit ribosomal protein S16
MQKMAIVMRLARFGGKKKPFYRIVVSDSRFPRDGRFIEKIGTYDPNKDPAEVHIMEDRAMEWCKRGAQPTKTVRNLLRQSGILKKLA